MFCLVVVAWVVVGAVEVVEVVVCVVGDILGMAVLVFLVP